jgi:activator of 2-hydroxyglutaryl-CoA dehydratase
MRFYKEHHQFYIGIDLHARTMYICVMNNGGDVVAHKNMTTTSERLQQVIDRGSHGAGQNNLRGSAARTGAAANRLCSFTPEKI